MKEKSFRNVCESFDILKYIRNILYSSIKVSDNGDLSQLPSVLHIHPHSQIDIANPIIVSHAYSADELLYLVHEDYQVCANLVPIECLLPLSHEQKLKDQIEAVRDEIKRIAVELINDQQGNIYFELSSDSIDCLRLSGEYIKATSMYFEADRLMIAGSDENGTVETCRADEIYIEDLCGLLLGHLGEL